MLYKPSHSVDNCVRTVKVCAFVAQTNCQKTIARDPINSQNWTRLHATSYKFMMHSLIARWRCLLPINMTLVKNQEQGVKCKLLIWGLAAHAATASGKAPASSGSLDNRNSEPGGKDCTCCSENARERPCARGSPKQVQAMSRG